MISWQTKEKNGKKRVETLTIICKVVKKFKLRTTEQDARTLVAEQT
jgi:hypothetical protein